MPRLVIVGASVAGVSAAKALRTRGYRGRISLLGAEDCPPYDKPPLSKSFLRDPAAAAPLLLTAEAAKDLDLDVRLGARAVGLDTGARTVALADGTAVGYDQLVVATGCRAVEPPWGSGDRVHVLRTLDDAGRLRAQLRPGRRLVVIGAGFVGLEVAATASRLGLEVTVVDAAPTAMSRAVSPDVAELVLGAHRRAGIRTVLGEGVASLVRRGAEVGLTLAGGTELTADVVLVGIGAVPNVEWLAGAGLDLDSGVLCDVAGRALGFPDISALGDVARWQRPGAGEPRRAEHWTAAVDQAAVLAGRLVDGTEPSPDDEPVDYVWTDQHELKIQICGDAAGPAADLLITDPHAATERAAFLYGGPGGRLRGAVVVNWPKAGALCRLALRRRSTLDGMHEVVVGLVPR